MKNPFYRQLYKFQIDFSFTDGTTRKYVKSGRGEYDITGAYKKALYSAAPMVDHHVQSFIITIHEVRSHLSTRVWTSPVFYTPTSSALPF